jgi:serine O-acetyltransferase
MRPHREQLAFLAEDVRQLTKGRARRLVPVLCSEAFAILAWYRCNRAAYLWLGTRWRVVRSLTAPMMPFVRAFVSSEIDYRSDLGPGLRLLHPQLGYVVNGRTVAGRGLILAGGNTLGGGAVRLGDHVQLGVNAVVIGDVHVGSGVLVGAGAVVVDDVAAELTVAGVPARAIGSRTGAAT